MSVQVAAKAVRINLQVEQGATFNPIWTWKSGATEASATPVDLTGCTARMQIREDEDDSTVLYELTTENSKIVLGDAAGTIEVIISDEDSAAFTWDSGVYDLEIEFVDGTVRRWSKGSVIVLPNVTR